MNRMEWWLLCWLVLSLVFHKVALEYCDGNLNLRQCPLGRHEVSKTKSCMDEVHNILKNGNHSNGVKTMQILEQVLEETEVNETTSMCVSRFVALLHRLKGPFTGLEIYASESEAMLENATSDSRVRVQLPGGLDAGSDNTIVFCMFTWPEANGNITGASGLLYESRLVGVSVRGKNISGLQDPVNITVKLTGNETEDLSCVFLNFSTNKFSSDGCVTLWEPGWRDLTCSCDHLTYFGVLMVSSPPFSQRDVEILTYITLIGCTLSLFVLAITVLMFFIKRKAREDVSMKVHINLAIALIFLNLHFLLSRTVAALSSTGLCFYVALIIHYSLLATFSWMSLEGFHLYLLLVQVFNIYVRRYLFKLSLVGWGVPAVIVLLVVIIDRGAYGHVSLDSSNPNSTEICYIGNSTVKMVTTLGAFGLVYLFNMTMFGVIVKRIVGLRQQKESGQSVRNACTLLGVSTLLGITWGLVFLSFGHLTTPGFYLFCILNPLQGFFIFLWFVMSLRKKESQANESNPTVNNT